MTLFAVVSHLQVQMGFFSKLARLTPLVLFPKCFTGPSHEYIWTPHNQNRALAAVNEARQVAERGAEETDAKREPQMLSLFRFFSDGFSNYRNSNLL